MSTLILPYPSTHPDLCHGKYVAGLFAKGEQGAWYDPSDLSTLFQDAYGTTPVTAVGQPVGLILDKSKRVIFKITKADLLDNAKWTGYNSNSVSASTPTAVQLADGTVRITRNSTDTYVGFAPRANAYSLPPGCVVHFKYSVKSKTNNASRFSGEPYYKWREVNPGWFGEIPNTSALTRNTVAINYTAAPITTNSVGWVPNLFGFYIFGAAADEYIDVFDFEITAYAPAARQLTATSRPTLQQDSSGKYYLSFDGVDDYLSTGSIDFTATDKMTVLAGVRKINALGTLGMLAELSGSSASNPGAFALGAPGISGHYQYLSKGTAEATANATNAALAGPITSVIAGLGSISGDQSILRVNGTQADQSTADQGTGNYGNYPIYIGRRGGTQSPFNGALYGLIVRGAATDDNHLTHAEQYLAYKSGVTL